MTKNDLECLRMTYNEQNELEYSKTSSQMSKYAQKHVCLYLHAQTNVNLLILLKINSNKKNSIRIFHKKKSLKIITRKIFVIDYSAWRQMKENIKFTSINFIGGHIRSIKILNFRIRK